MLIGDYDKMSVSNSVCVLESMGIDVTIAKSAIEIMERLNKGEKYDLIITNNIYDRENCDGSQLLYELRECNIKIVVEKMHKLKREKGCLCKTFFFIWQIFKKII